MIDDDGDVNDGNDDDDGNDKVDTLHFSLFFSLSLNLFPRPDMTYEVDCTLKIAIPFTLSHALLDFAIIFIIFLHSEFHSLPPSPPPPVLNGEVTWLQK